MPSIQDFWSRLLPRLDDWREKARRIAEGLAEKLPDWREKVSTKCQALGSRLSAFFQRIRDFFRRNSWLNEMRDKEARAMEGFRERLASKTEAIRDKISAGTASSSGRDFSTPRPEWLEKGLLAKKVALGTLNEKWLAFQGRLATRWNALWHKLTAKSRQVVVDVTQSEYALETRMEASHPMMAKAMHVGSHPLRWMREKEERGIAVAAAIFGLTLLSILIQVSLWAAHRQSVIADNCTLLYDTHSKRLKAYPAEVQPGTGDAVGILIFTHAGNPIQPREGMSLADLEKRGLVVGWFFRLDPTTSAGMYATPDDPETWVAADSKDIHSWLNQSLREANQKAAAKGDHDDLIPCTARVRELKEHKR